MKHFTARYFITLLTRYVTIYTTQLDNFKSVLATRLSLFERSFDGENVSVLVPSGGGETWCDLSVPVSETFVVVGEQQNLTTQQNYNELL